MNGMVIIDNLLHDQVIDLIMTDLSDIKFRKPHGGGEERETFVKNVKQHTELRPHHDKIVGKHSQYLQGLLMKSKVVAMVVQPKKMRYFQFNHYSGGQNYGWHNDASHMGGLRTDFTVVIGLSDPSSYEGGDHLFYHDGETSRVRVQKGQALLYPSGVLHRVTPVTKGTRVVGISWIESLIKSAAHRDMLIEIQQLMGFCKKSEMASIRAISLYGNLRREFAG